MKKLYLFVLVGILGCFLLACDDSPEPANAPVSETDDDPIGEPPPVPRVFMEVELINNTGGDITVFGPFFVNTDTPFGFDANFPSWKTNSYTAAGNTAGFFMYGWSPKYHLPDKKAVERFQPFMGSYMLEIRVDGETHYLAGWPRSMGIPSAHDEEGVPKDFDGGKIVQYGIGYGNNTQFAYDEYGVARIPFIVSYDTEGGTEEREFVFIDYQEAIRWKAVITVDAPDKIEFRTESLSLPPDDLYGYCQGLRSEYKVAFFATEEGKEHMAVCPACRGAATFLR